MSESTIRGSALADRIVLSATEAAALAERALQRIGYSVEEARVIAAHLVESELCGYPALGLTRVLTIAEHPRTREPRRPVAVVRETPVIHRVKSVRQQPGVEAIRIRIPSERAYAERERRRVDGIALERVLYDRICALTA